MLTDVQVRKAKPSEKDYKLSDERGLYLYVTTKGARIWRMKYRFGGKEQRLIFGRYPEVTLTEARNRRDDARRQLRDHQNPAIERRKAKMASAANAEMTFEKVARAWHETQTPRWAPVHAADVLRSLERDVFPEMGALPIRDIDAPTVLATLRKIEKRSAIETAKRVRQRVSGVFVYAISEGIAVNDPAAIVAGALKPVPKRGKQPALRTIEEARELLALCDASKSQPVTKLASRLLALTDVRPGIVWGAAWPEFEGIDWSDPDAPAPGALWRVPAARMKLVLDRKDDDSFEHVVPLAPAAVDVLRTIRRLTRRMRFVFPGERHSHHQISSNAVAFLYKRLGYAGKHVPHGWRATFSTIMNEIGVQSGRAWIEPIVELMLAHVPDNKVKAAYDRATHMERRRELAEEWANLLMVGAVPAGDLLKGPRR